MNEHITDSASSLDYQNKVQVGCICGWSGVAHIKEISKLWVNHTCEKKRI